MDPQIFDSLFAKFRYPILITLGGLVLVAAGVLFFKSGLGSPTTKVEVLSGSTETQETQNLITVEVAGEILSPGVYKLTPDKRVEDLLIVSGGLTLDADREWTDKYLNRAAKLSDGQKVYIPSVHEQSIGGSARNLGGDQTISSGFSAENGTKVNINTATLKELDSLPGIGQTYGQNIIEHRPYSDVSELLSKDVLKKNVYLKIKDLITVY